MARIENKSTGTTTQQSDSKQPVSKAVAAGAIVGAIVLCSLIGYLMTRRVATTSKEGEMPRITSEMLRSAGGGASGGATSPDAQGGVPGPPSAPPSAMQGAPVPPPSAP